MVHIPTISRKTISSRRCQKYQIFSSVEAVAFLMHATLGSRYAEICNVAARVLTRSGKSPTRNFADRPWMRRKCINRSPCSFCHWMQSRDFTVDVHRDLDVVDVSELRCAYSSKLSSVSGETVVRIFRAESHHPQRALQSMHHIWIRPRSESSSRS